MKQSKKILRWHASALALALVLGMSGPLAPTLVRAEQRCLSAQQDSPLETARKLKELTAGGLFNPVEANPCDTRPASDSQHDGDTSSPTTLLDPSAR